MRGLRNFLDPERFAAKESGNQTDL